MWLCSVERLGFVAEREYNALETDAHEESDKCLCGNMQRITKYKDMTVYAIIRVIKYLRKETQGRWGSLAAVKATHLGEGKP